MKKRLCSAVLALALCLVLPSPALAAERMKGYDYGDAEKHYTVEKTLEGPSSDAVLLWRDNDFSAFSDPTVRSYELWLCWENDCKRLILPSTARAGGDQYFEDQYPTDRGPEELSFNEDGSVLTYVYRFGDALYNAAGELLHDAGTYTYQVDAATGELKVEFEKTAGAEGTTFVDVGPGDWFAPYVEVCVEEGLMKGVGGDQFDPQGTVTLAQAATLAARIHHIKNGGDGNLPHAPENYGVLTVTFENGQSLTFQSSEYRLHPIPMTAVFGADVSEEQLATLDWMDEEGDTPAAMTAELIETVGPLPCRAYWNGPRENGWLRLKPRLDASEEERSAFSSATVDLNMLRRPLPGDWYRDTIYYLEGVLGASETYSASGQWKWGEDGSAGAADRGDFVEALHATAADLLTPKLNDITDFPDAEAEYGGKELADMVLDFYNAGVMTGKDEQGTFDKASSLTRAEAAAICARILKSELRVKFQPQPVPEKVSYALTHLTGAPMDGHTVASPAEG